MNKSPLISFDKSLAFVDHMMLFYNPSLPGVSWCHWSTRGEENVEQPVPVKERYRCDECGLRLTADEVRWSEKERALCPRCEWPLDPPGTPAALPPAGTEPGTCSECGLVIAEDEVRWSSDGRSLCPRCEFPLGPVRKRAN